MQDIELTIERGKLYILQTRNGKRTAQAALKIAHDMVGEGLFDKKEALLRIDPEHLAHVLHRQIDSSADLTVLGRRIGGLSGRGRSAPWCSTPTRPSIWGVSAPR